MPDPPLSGEPQENWFWATEAERYGPLAFEEMAELIRSWRIGRRTLVWHPSMSGWTPAESVPAFGSYFEQQHPPPLLGDSDDGQQSPSPARSSPGDSPDEDSLGVSPSAEETAPGREPSGDVRARFLSRLPWPSANRARAMLVVMAILAIVSAMATYSQIALLDRAASGVQIAASQAEASDRRVTMISLIWSVGYLLTAIAFIMWLRQVYDAASDLDTEALRYSKGWTIGGWVIPIAFLYIPYHILKDAWTVLAPTDDEYGWPNLLGWWWMMWIVMNILAWFSLRWSTADSIADLQFTSWLSLASDLAAVIAASTGVLVVSRLTRTAADVQVGHVV